MSEIAAKNDSLIFTGKKPSERQTARIVPPSKSIKKAPSKMCTRCRGVKILTDFYGNKGWTAQSYVDSWCKDCVRQHCSDIVTLREYCWYNNRKWSDEFWDRSFQAATYKLANDQEYLKGSKAKRKKLEDMATCSHFLKTMNLAVFYYYSPNIDGESQFKEFKEDSIAGTFNTNPGDAREDDEDSMYSAKWNGIYSKRELEFLDAYYDDLQKEYSLDTKNLKDYAKKVCIASLNADNANNRYRKGEIPIGEWRDAINLFDNLSKSSMFSACKRKVDDRETGMSFSEKSLQLQASGKIEMVQPFWKPDSVDACIKEYMGIAEKLKYEGVFT